MSSHLEKLLKKGLINSHPHWLESSVQYEVITGSVAYGVSNDTSDMDVYGFCIPTKDILFPHLSGYIEGFGTPPQRFEQFNQQHLVDKEAKKEYDITIYNIVKYFDLVMENNPNMIDSLFVSNRCVLHCTEIGNMVRDSRTMFLHKGAWHKFKGYAWSQKSKIRILNQEVAKDCISQYKIMDKDCDGKRREIIEKHGFDVKFAYHIIRLMNEIEQILTIGDIDLEQDKDRLKAIRNGQVSLKQIEDWFTDKERHLEKFYQESTLQNQPDELRIKQLLLNCLEHHYGSLNEVVKVYDKNEEALKQIRLILDKTGV